METSQKYAAYFYASYFHETVSHVNPFEFGRELTSSELVDREDERATLARVLQENGRLFLVGPRRYGKTSLLRVSAEQAEREGDAVVLRHDAEAYPTLHRLTEALLADATRRLAGPVEKAGQKVSRFFGALRPEVSFDPVTGSLSASLGASDQAPSPALLVEVLGGIDRLAGESGKHVAIVLDEFQHVVDLNDGFAAERQLRAAVQTHANLAYVFAGSKTALLSEMTGNADRPFYRLGERLFLGPIPRPDFRAFLQRGFASGGFGSTDEATEAVLDAAEDVPYNVQRLAHACWNDLLYRGAGARLEGSDVERVLARLVAQDDPFYTQTWNRLAASQRAAVLAVVEKGGQGLYSRETLRSARLPMSTMRTAVEALEKIGVVRAEEARGAVRLRLEDPFFGTWLRQFVREAG